MRLKSSGSGDASANICSNKPITYSAFCSCTNKASASAYFLSGTPMSCALINKPSRPSQSHKLAAALISLMMASHLSQKIIRANARLYNCGPCSKSQPSCVLKPSPRTLSKVTWMSTDSSNTKQFFKSRIKAICSFNVFTRFSISETTTPLTPFAWARASICWISSRSALSLNSSSLPTISALTRSSMESAAKMVSKCFCAACTAEGPSGNNHLSGLSRPCVSAALTHRSTSVA
mmetsp:Transcript_55150/g.159667  ORF Transcript_55150/g.159667 Transcript_55150/m.159667 type:complete len:234 (-) Transcript_55150:830-1531(-)